MYNLLFILAVICAVSGFLIAISCDTKGKDDGMTRNEWKQYRRQEVMAIVSVVAVLVLSAVDIGLLIRAMKIAG